MASRRELLDSISCDMRLDKSFFLGCSRAREYYNRFVNEYEKEHDQQMKNVAKWYKKQCEKEFEEYERKAVREKFGERSKSEYQFEGFPEDW